MKNKIILTTAIALISTVLFAQTPKAYITNFGDSFISVVDIQKNQKIAVNIKPQTFLPKNLLTNGDKSLDQKLFFGFGVGFLAQIGVNA